MGASFLEDLNPEQREAAAHVEGPLLILAGAGSGKTRVITHRIAHLVRTEGVAPGEILAVTFTNKAAGEMRRRLGELLGWAAASAVWASTFHSAGVRILRRDGHHLGLPPNLVVYDDADQRALVRRITRQLGLDPSLYPDRQLLSRIDKVKSGGGGPGDLEVSLFDPVGEKARVVFEHYQKALRAAGAVDFGDLLVESVRLLQEVPTVRERYQRELRFVMVDEFQDTSPVQYALIRLLAGPRRNLVVVGDDDQAIYRWRGADIRNILSFERDYPDAKVVRLERNYRSTQVILDAAHAVIERNPSRKDKRLWTDRDGGELLQVLQVSDEQDEARLVAARLDALAERHPRRELAVFYRVNAQSRVLEDALRAARIPYHVVRGRSFYDRAEIKDLTSYLRLSVNPRSDADVLRVINTPRRGLGKKTVERLQSAALSAGQSLFEVLETGLDLSGVSAAALKKLHRFRDLVAGLHAQVIADRPPQDVVEAAITESGYARALTDEGTEEAAERLANLQEMIAAAAARADEGKSLMDFLDEMALTGDADGGAADEGDAVSLMTLHAAKGLEFDGVVIVGMEERTFPHGRAFQGFGGLEEDEAQMAEERRLCYVGFTRARQELVLTCARTRFLNGQRQVRSPSRFLGEIPPELVAGVPVAPVWGTASALGALGGFGGPGRRGGFDDDLAEEPELGEEDGIVVDYTFDQRPAGEGGGVVARGRQVRHRTFGTGEIRSVDGRGPQARLLVHFEGVGTKKILARYVELI